MAYTSKLLEKYGYHEWLCHTNFSFLVGASHPKDYICRAVSLGYKSMGITDYDGVYGLARTYLERKRLCSPNLLKQDYKIFADERGNPKLNLRYGVEFHLEKDHHLPLVYQDTLALIATNKASYTKLCELSSYSHREGKKHPSIPFEHLCSQSLNGLIAIQPMRGLIRKIYQNQKNTEYYERIRILRELFPKRFFLILSRHLHPAEDMWIRPVLAISKKLDIPWLISQDPFFHEPRQKIMSDLLHSIRINKTLEQSVDHMFVNNQRSLQTLSEITRRYRPIHGFKEALRTACELQEQFDFDLDSLSYQYPSEWIPEEATPHSFLTKLVWAETKKRFCIIPEKLKKLLMKELKLVEELAFADYFLTVWDIVKWAKSQHILCQGRGSAANSAICFVLGITPVDPTKFNTLFERFISAERGDPPDIDVDFEHERREEVIHYIYQRFGRKRAAMVANVITFRRKGALRVVGKALDISEDKLKHASKTLDTKHFRNSNTQNILQESLGTTKNVNEKNLHTTWAQLTENLVGFPRHLGIHSGGFILTQNSIDTLVAQEPATMRGRTVIQWCKEDIEGLGFFKIDILCLGMLTAIKKSFGLLKEHYNLNLNMNTIPQDDPGTYRMIQRADTVGTFQIESRAQMSMLPRLRPKNFYDLAIEIAIIRPGPIQGKMIHPYLRRRNNLEAIVYPHEEMRPILERTLGIPIFQEQVMRIAMSVGDFTPGEANELRRKMGSWNLKGDLGPWLKKLAQGMRNKGIAENFIQNILEQMKGFADYGFPESHSISFAIIAYASCYLKHHYPSVFFAAMLNSQPLGFYSPHTLLRTAKQNGVTILPICVNNSEYDCTLEKSGSSENLSLRIGLRYVKALSKKGALRLVRKRRELPEKKWNRLDEFMRCVQLYRNDMTALAAANAMSAFGVTRKSTLWLAETVPLSSSLEEIEPGVVWKKENRSQKIMHDFSATGIYLGEHPTKIIQEEQWCYPISRKNLYSSKDLITRRDNSRTATFGMVLARQAPPSAKGMVFFTLEDDYGFINLVFDPKIYRKFYRLLETTTFICSEGILQKNNEAHSILVKTVYPPSPPSAEIYALKQNHLQSENQPKPPKNILDLKIKSRRYH